MVRKISIATDPEKKELGEAVEKMNLEEPFDHSVKEFFDDFMDGKLGQTWKDLENIVSEIFNSRLMAKIYLLLIKSPGKSFEEITSFLEDSRQQVASHLKKLLSLGYIRERREERAGKGSFPVYFAASPQDVVRRVAQSLEKKMMALANIDTMLLKTAKKLTLFPIKIIIGEEEAEGSK